MAELLKKLANTCGIVVVTDSDVAGFSIRNYIKSITKNANIINVYIPDILGKEKRKRIASKEGKLGVEGVPIEIILDAFNKAGVFCENNSQSEKKITKLDFFEDGLSGNDNSSEYRKKLLKHLDLPEHLSSNSLLDVINSLMTYDEYKQVIEVVKNKN
jgi:ribonuclease M5